MQNKLTTLQTEMSAELKNILGYWIANTLDDENGGFVGQIDNENNIFSKANKGIILNSRILWAFSNACNFYKNQDFRPYADRAYGYLKTYFKDTENIGVFWELDYSGKPVNRRKQIYAQAFTIYALSAFYRFSKNEEAKNWAIEIYNQIEKTANDRAKLGYIEAFAEDWSPIEDMRLSNKDMNASKTMNTHLHLLEAYTELLKIFPDENLHKNLHDLVRIFINKFVNHNTFHCELFFDDDWNLLSDTVSFGHDIETAWLLIEAAKSLNDNALIKETENLAVNIADVFLNEGLYKDFGVMNERHADGSLDTDRHWWQQAEAVVGLCYVYKITNNEKYLDNALKIWDFTKEFILDHRYGEWFWRVDENENPYMQEDKVGMWKCPYHNTRACVQVNRLGM